MAKKYYLEKTESGLLRQKQLFTLNLPAYSSAFGITQQQIKSDKNDTIYLKYLFDKAELAKTTSKQVIEAKKIFVYGKIGSVEPIMANQTVITPPAVQVKPGIVQRFIKLARYIKNHPKYTADTGKEMGIEKDEKLINFKILSPKINSIKIINNKVVIDFKIGDMHGIQIYTSYDNLSWIKYDKDYRSPWEDNRKNQTEATERRFYKLVYIYADKEVGKPSQICEIITDIH